MDSSVVSSATGEETVLIRSSPSSESTDDSNTLEKHPLMIPLIVKKIVEHLDPSFEQLKTLRLVSKIFTQVTLHHWRNSCAVLTLIPDPTLFTAPKYSEGLPVSQFLAEFQDPESPFQLAAKPFSKYKFKGITFDVQVCNKAGGPGQAFWNTLGPLVETLYFESCIFLKPDSVKKVTCPMVQLLVTMIPNVKHLVLNDVDTQEAENSNQKHFPVFVERPHLSLQTLTVYGDMEEMSLKDLFKMAPHLESIKGVDLPNVPMSEEAIMNPIYQVRFKAKPRGIPEPPSLSNLKHLDLINSSSFLDNDYSWEALLPPQRENVPQFPLETLTLHLEQVAAITGLEIFENSEELNKYLFSFSGTLKTLKLYRAPVGPPFSKFLSGGSGATEMSLLTELELWGTIAPDFGFLKSTPNLKRLTINLGCFEKRKQLKTWITEHYRDYGDNAKYQTYKEDMVAKVPRKHKQGGRRILCTELEYLEVDYEFPEESLRILGKWMPNLKTLKTVLNRRTIPVVCKVWRELTELVCLHGSQIGDSCFIRDEETAGFSRGPPPQLKLCDLKELERFQVDVYCGESELTDEAIFKGFVKMSGLKSVRICVNDSEMSEEAEKALREVVQFCQVIRNDKLTSSDNFDEDGSAICGCDRCTFRSEAEKGLRGVNDDVDEDDYGSLSFFGSDEEDGMLWREDWRGFEDEEDSDFYGDNEEF